MHKFTSSLFALILLWQWIDPSSQMTFDFHRDDPNDRSGKGSDLYLIAKPTSWQHYASSAGTPNSLIVVNALSGWTRLFQSCDEVRNVTWITIAHINAEFSAQDACHCRVFRPNSLPWQEGDVISING